MKAFCNIVNLLAMIMVLLLGAVSVHAHEPGHVHETELSTVFDAAHVDLQSADLAVDGHPADGSAMHCGAPILGPQAVDLGCVITVAEVIYPPERAVIALELSSGNLRPPRR